MMNSFRKSIERLASHVTKEWRKQHYDLKVFPGIASLSLQRYFYDEAPHYEDIIDWLKTVSQLPKQLEHSDPYQFGQPAITVHWNNRFLIDVYFWVTPEISIHNHSFSGAFISLFGKNLHCVYSFSQKRKLHDRIQQGQLKFDRSEIMSPGSVHEIRSGPDFVHRVWHLSHPTISMVIRTYQDHTHPVLYTYHLSGLAISTLPLSERLHHTTIKKMQAMQFLHRIDHPQKEPFTEQIVMSADPWSCFLYLSRYLEITGNLRNLTRMTTNLHRQKKNWAKIYEAHFRDEHNAPLVNWENVSDEQQRMLLASLLSFTNREHVMKAIKDYDSIVPADRFIVENLRNAIRMKNLNIAFPPIAYDLLKLLLKDLSFRRICLELKRLYAPYEVSRKMNEIKQTCAELTALPLMRPLFTHNARNKCR